MATDSKQLDIFGGAREWKADDWTSSDDRVRGGKSQSYLKVDQEKAIFYGVLDIKTLGGAGFASQRTTGDDREWNLSDYAGIQLNISKGDKKRYTLNLKDELLPTDPETGREQSTVSYEVDFELPPQNQPGETYEQQVFIPWSSLIATYRGRIKKDARPIDLTKIRRFSIMMRSFFGTQDGEFSLSITSIAALPQAPPPSVFSLSADPSILEKGLLGAASSVQTPNRIIPVNSLVLSGFAAVALFFYFAMSTWRWHRA